MSTRNRKVLMKRHPDAKLALTDFEIVETEIERPGTGQVLIKNLYLSLDPYVRAMMDPVRSYVANLNPGDLMPGFGVGRVEQSDHPALPPGTYVVGRLGWQSFSLAAANTLRVVDPKLAPISTALGVLGMPGAAAYYGLLHVGQPKAGETVVVSAAAGAVGGLAGQIAKIMGCRVVGIAGGAEKCAYVRTELRFDECLDYRHPEFKSLFEAATPNFVDVSFENVGGFVMDTVLGRLQAHARIAFCGAISELTGAAPKERSPLTEIVRQRATMTGFIISEHLEMWPRAFADIGQWIKKGKIKYRETIAEGLEEAPAAFIGMLSGHNIGKQLVRISEDGV